MDKQLRTSLLYLLVILVALITSVTLIIYFWYPYSFVQAAGAKNILLTVFAINAILAFVLTFLIFNNKNNNLNKNLIIALVIQLFVFVVSFYAVYKIKPVWIAYNVDRFELILNTDLVNTKIDAADDRFKSPSYLSPQYVGVEFSSDNEERNSNMFDEVLQGISIAQRPERYIPYEEVSTQIKDRAQELTLLEKYNNKNIVQSILSKYPQADSFVPLQAKAVNMTVLLNKNDDDQVVAIVNLRPW